MNRLLVGALVASCLSLFSVSSDAKEGDSASGSKKPEPIALSKAGLSGTRRYQLLFSPDLDVIGALKMPPVLSLSAPSAIPTQSTVTLGATIQYISASEIGSLQVLLDGSPTSACGAFNAAYESTCNFSSSLAGTTHTLSLRLTETGSGAAVTVSPTVSVEMINSQVLGAFQGFTGSDPNRYIVGWACSTGYATPLAITLWNAQVPEAQVERLANSTGSDPADLAATCKSTGTTYRFRIRIDPAMYLSQTGSPVQLKALSAQSGQGLISLTGPSYLINERPTVTSTSRTPTVSPYTHATGTYLQGEQLTLSAQLADQALPYDQGAGSAGVTAAWFRNGSVEACPLQTFPAATPKNVSCAVTPTVGPYSYTVRATDNRGANGVTTAVGSAVTIVSPTPALSQATLNLSNNLLVLTGSNLVKSVRVEVSNASTNVSLGSFSVLSASATSVSVTLTTSQRAAYDSVGLKLKVVNLTSGLMPSEWSSNQVTILGNVATLIRPTSGSAYPTGQAILLEAAVPGSNVSKVEFLGTNDSVVATGYIVDGYTPPRYVGVWNEVPSGDHQIKARVTFASGSPTTSSSVSVHVASDVVP